MSSIPTRLDIIVVTHMQGGKSNHVRLPNINDCNHACAPS